METEGLFLRRNGGQKEMQMRFKYSVGVLACLTLFVAPTVAITQQSTELIIRGGVVVNSDGRTEGDIRIKDGKITEIGQNLVAGQGAREIDATNLLVLPGGIDPHTHLVGQSPDYKDDYTSGSAAALAGGVTTISNQVPALLGEELIDAVNRVALRVRAEAIADVMIHPIVLDPLAESLEGMKTLVEQGQPSVKVRMHRGECG